jgi:ribose-phosphate pyrophosphokinase
MNIYSRAGALPFTAFSFPDGQRHVKLLALTEFSGVTIEAAITSSDDLMDVLLAKDVLDTSGYITSLDIRYLLGARMDRHIDKMQPFTLRTVARMINAAGFRRIRILDPHSVVSCNLLDATPVYPTKVLATILNAYHPATTVVIAPDAGAAGRVRVMTPDTFDVRQARKHRDPQTGFLSLPTMDDLSFVKGKTYLIVDDICDGGRTFTHLADLLKGAGATAVDLFVTHGIFSHGLPLDGIHSIYTTDSLANQDPDHCVVFPIRMSEM